MIRQEIIFTKEECENIIRFHKEYDRDQHYNNEQEDQKEILYEASVLPKNPRTLFVFKKLFDFFEEKSNFKLYRYPTEVYIMKYGKGDRFKRHKDTINDRIFSIGIQLSEDYMGGEYILYPKDDTVIINRNLGNTYLMDSSVYHEIKEIEYGIRYSLVSFIHKSDLVENKSKGLI